MKARNGACLRVAWLVAIGMLASGPAAATGVDWPVKFSDSSSKQLIAIHEALCSPRLDNVQGIPVHDVVWKADAIEVRIKSGAVFLEPPVEGAPVGAFFVGEATAHFTPIADEQRRQLDFWFGRPSFDGEPITHAYFFTLRGSDLLTQLGTTGTPSIPFEAADAYVEVKQAVRQRGVDTVQAFLNRDGAAQGSAFIIMTAPGVRVGRSKSTLLMLRYDPTLQEETGIEAYGSESLSSTLPWKFLFRTVSAQQAASPRFQPQAENVSYRIDLKLGNLMESAEQTSTITLRPSAGVRAMRLDLTPWLQVQSVRVGNERELPFLQWKRDSSGDNLDESLLIDLGDAMGSASGVDVRVKSSGALFEPWGDAYFLIDEDAWYPEVRDVRAAAYELRVGVPPERTAVAPGRLVAQTEDDAGRHYDFKTTRPQKASSLYLGKFQTKSGEADGTKIEVYAGQSEKNVSFALVEMQNIVKVYNRLFVPLEMETLRVAAAPVNHGRGFEGLLLLSADAGFYGSDSQADLFRAHEVAHQWWGNMVQPDRWPRDRWLSESFAEYASMEYFRARFEDSKKTREAISSQWMMPLQRSPKSDSGNLRGEARSASVQEQWSILDGGQNVYTKGPMVIQMLRYMSSVQSGNDDAFWKILRTFLQQYSGKTATTEDFIAVSQQVLNTDLRWFWSQWLLRTEIPKVRWSHRVEPKDGKFLLTVEAQQMDTDFTLLIPVYAHFGSDKIAARPLVMKGRTGKLQLMLPQKPGNITINDNWEALIEIVQ